MTEKAKLQLLECVIQRSFYHLPHQYIDKYVFHPIIGTNLVYSFDICDFDENTDFPAVYKIMDIYRLRRTRHVCQDDDPSSPIIHYDISLLENKSTELRSILFWGAIKGMNFIGIIQESEKHNCYFLDFICPKNEEDLRHELSFLKELIEDTDIPLITQRNRYYENTKR